MPMKFGGRVIRRSAIVSSAAFRQLGIAGALAAAPRARPKSRLLDFFSIIVFSSQPALSRPLEFSKPARQLQCSALIDRLSVLP
jgi:hypothetical protein